jgi:hypothetical protein
MHHIGILAHSADGAALCALEMVRESARLLGEHEHPEITLSILPMGPALALYARGDLAGVERAAPGNGRAARQRRLRVLRMPRQHGAHRARRRDRGVAAPGPPHLRGARRARARAMDGTASLCSGRAGPWRARAIPRRSRATAFELRVPAPKSAPSSIE